MTDVCCKPPNDMVYNAENSRHFVNVVKKLGTLLLIIQLVFSHVFIFLCLYVYLLTTYACERFYAVVGLLSLCVRIPFTVYSSVFPVVFFQSVSVLLPLRYCE